MRRLMYQPADSTGLVETEAARLPEVMAGPGWWWLDVQWSNPNELDDIFAALDIAEVVVDDALADSEMSKLVDLGAYTFVVSHSPALDAERLRSVELDALLSESYLVTMRREPIPGVEWTWERALEGDPIAAEGPDVAMALVLEAGGRRVLALVAALEEEITRLEDLAIGGHPEVVTQLQPLRRDVILLRRVIAPQRDMVQALEREGPLLGPRSQRLLASVRDDHQRLVESLDTARALLGNVLDSYRSTVAERMNEVMKVLTVFAAIVLPLSLIAGVYGMNFSNMPELEWRWAYFVLLGIMATVAAALWVYFARRGFIGGPRVPRVDRVVGKGLAGLITLTTLPVRGVVSLLKTEERDEGGG